VAGALASVVLVLVLAAVAAYILARQAGSPPPQQRATQASAQAAAKARNVVAAWVAAQVSRTARVSCDRVMCDALKAHGLAAARLLVLNSGHGNPLRSDVIVATPAVRGILGSRLDLVYAPVVIQSFGSGSGRIDIRVIAPHGRGAYLSALRKDVAARKASARQLLQPQNTQVTAAPLARRQLAAGQVDARLLVSLTFLAAQQPISIAAFGDLGAGASTGIPMRSAVLAETRSVTGAHRAAYQRSMLALLRAEHGVYRPALIQLGQVAGRHVVRIEFDAPSPLGLIGPSGP
jgi:hypothetical protein